MESFNVAIDCGSFLLPWNAVMLALGILVAVVVTEIVVKKRGLYKDLALDACIVGIPCGIVGGRIFSALSGKIAFASLFDLTKTGLNLPGALLLAGVGILLYVHFKKLNRGEAFDAIMPGAFFGLAVGRWSDFFLCDGLGPIAGESVPKFFPLVTFTNGYFVDHKTVAYAVFFLDFLICLALGVTALILLKRRMKPGKCARVTAILYLFAEFILEWLRAGDARQIVFGELRFNQIVLFGLLLIVVLLSLIRKKETPVAVETAEPTEPTKPEVEPTKPEEEPESEA